MVTLNKVKGGEIGPGELLTRAAWADLLAEVGRSDEGGETPLRRLTNPHLLYSDPSRILWWSPRRRQTIYFRTGRKAFDEAVNGEEVNHPSLLFLATASNLYIYALQGRQRPDETTPVFAAPYFNVYADGHMCRGNITLPDRANPADIPLWEDAFFQTNFTHSNRGDNLTAYLGGHDGAWKAAIGAAFDWDDHLIPQGLTVREVLNK
jgi:PRTRC genetic system protein B